MNPIPTSRYKNQWAAGHPLMAGPDYAMSTISFLHESDLIDFLMNLVAPLVPLYGQAKDLISRLVLMLVHSLVSVLVCRLDRPIARIQQQPCTRPSLNGKFILYLVIPRDSRVHVAGDLDEEFAEILSMFGPKRAQFWYWFQVVRTCGYYIGRAVLKLVSPIAKLERLIDTFGKKTT